MNCELETRYAEQGFKNICGVDEVGMGCLAGPIVAASVILDLPDACTLSADEYGIGDSKQIPPKAREQLYSLILKNAVAIGVGVASVDELNQFAAQKLKPLAVGGNLARVRAVENLCKRIGTKFPHQKIDLIHFQSTSIVAKSSIKADLALVDHFTLKNHVTKSIGITKGDTKVISIAAASIIAKTCRDAYMLKLSHRFDNYGWDSNMGYGVPAHVRALKEYGPTPHHRTFALKSLLVQA